MFPETRTKRVRRTGVFAMRGVFDFRAFRANRRRLQKAANGFRKRRAEKFEIGSLAFQCPKTLVEIGSGIELDRRTLEKIRWLDIRVRCASCGNVHEYTVASGKLAPFRAPFVRQQFSGGALAQAAGAGRFR
jgi:hypothetical protein